MKTRITETSAHSAQGWGVKLRGRLVATWLDKDCYGGHGAHEAATEFRYEFGGEIVPIRETTH